MIGFWIDQGRRWILSLKLVLGKTLSLGPKRANPGTSEHFGLELDDTCPASLSDILRW